MQRLLHRTKARRYTLIPRHARHKQCEAAEAGRACDGQADTDKAGEQEESGREKIVPLLTGIIRWCPAYVPLKVSTDK